VPNPVPETVAFYQGCSSLLPDIMPCFQELDMSPGDPKWLDVIERDLHRQFPFHEMFVSRGGHG
jgi:hypothetical protein